MVQESRTDWFKSSRSNAGCACVEVKFASGQKVLVRDSKYLRNPANNLSAQPIISVGMDDWMAFLCEVERG